MSDEIVKAEAEQAAREATSVADEWLEVARVTEIETVEEYNGAGDLLKQVKARYRQIEARRKEITKPLNDALASVNDLFRQPREKLLELEALLKGKIAGYAAAKANANSSAIEAARAASTPEEASVELAKIQFADTPKNIGIRPTWKFEVTDPELVPREFCSPDLKKIAAVPAMTPIAGVRWFQESVVTVRK